MQVYWWHDKYRPRKPKYFNRVHTGYEWNKYNQTHYDHDNPPPKVCYGRESTHMHSVPQVTAAIHVATQFPDFVVAALLGDIDPHRRRTKNVCLCELPGLQFGHNETLLALVNLHACELQQLQVMLVYVPHSIKGHSITLQLLNPFTVCLVLLCVPPAM